MKLIGLLGPLLIVQPTSAAASLTMKVNGTITSQYVFDKDKIPQKTETSFEGSNTVNADLFGEKINRKEPISQDIKPKDLDSAAQEILAPFVARNNKEGLQTKVHYDFDKTNCDRFGESMICETRLKAQLTGE